MFIIIDCYLVLHHKYEIYVMLCYVMCGSMVLDIQSLMAEIRRGKKERRRKKKPQGKNIMSASVTQGGHKEETVEEEEEEEETTEQKYNGLPYYIRRP